MKEQENNPFKKMETTKEVPGDVKAKVMKNLSVLKLFGDITDLFSGKMGKTALELLKKNKKH